MNSSFYVNKENPVFCFLGDVTRARAYWRGRPKEKGKYRKKGVRENEEMLDRSEKPALW
jgi:hypothetical protein